MTGQLRRAFVSPNRAVLLYSVFIGAKYTSLGCTVLLNEFIVFGYHWPIERIKDFRSIFISGSLALSVDDVCDGLVIVIIKCEKL
jgi:hypothetical protein